MHLLEKNQKIAMNHHRESHNQSLLCSTFWTKGRRINKI